ncbi:MAG: L-2-hydroxyglutarate oxidase [Longimicrobiales bacterium]
MPSATPDFLVVGAGIVGLTVARELKRRLPGASVLVIEKEGGVGRHSSGRNSGVLHAGFYYTADSLKARFARVGNLRMQEFCEAEGLPLLKCGKLVVARNEGELPQLQELVRRGEVNGVPVERVTEAEARKLEPRVRTHRFALFSPSTASVEPGAVMERLAQRAREEGIEVWLDAPFRGASEGRVETAGGPVSPGFLVNAAGIQADRVARAFGFAEGFTMLPFRGMYLEGERDAPPLSLHVYPVPDMRQPFLGLHFTVTALGKVKIGPTAAPALGRERYTPADGLDPKEALEILGWEASLFLRNSFGFRTLAAREARKLSRAHLVRMGGEMVEGVEARHFRRWGKPGIRAQLFNTRTRMLEMDFVYEGDDRSLHVLNSVSPAFTCAFPFAEHLVDEIERAVA